jgi:radical SAM protein with 4Fe4S-binding SPASM domain
MGCTTGMDVRQDSKKKLTIADADIFIPRIMKDAVEKGFSECRFKLGGGEPTLSGTKWIHEMAILANKYATEYKIKIDFVILTNGIAISDELITIMKQQNIRFSVSLDPERVVPGTAIKTFPLVLRNLKRLVEAGVNGNGQLTVYKNNLEILPKMYNTISDLGVSIAWSLFRPQDKLQEQYNRAQDLIPGLKNLFKQIYNRILENKFTGQLTSFDYMDLSGVANAVCGAGETYIVLDYNGDIYTCHETIKSGKPLATCSDSANIFDSIRNKFLVGNARKTDEIEGDALFDLHGGKGCPWVRKAENGDFSRSSRNTQDIYDYMGTMLLHMNAFLLSKN